MTAISEMTALETLDWSIAAARHHTDLYPRLADAIRFGVDDPDIVVQVATDWDLQKRVRAAVERGESIPSHLAPLLMTVGPEVLLREPENADLWAEIAATLHASPRRNATPPSAVISAMLASGRSPAVLRELATAALESDADADAFGFAPDLTTEVIRELAAAGIRTPAQMADFFAAGLTAAEALPLAQAGVAGSAARVAQLQGIPRDQWIATLAGIPARWFGFERGREWGAHQIPGITWDIMRELATSGWEDAGSGGLTNYGRRSDGSLIPIALRLARAGIGYTAWRAWQKALTVGKPAARASSGAPALLGGYRQDGVVADAAIALRARGVRPSHVAEWRASGARSVDDVLAALDAGITVVDAKAIRARIAPPKRWPSDRWFIPSIQHLIRAHQGN